MVSTPTQSMNYDIKKIRSWFPVLEQKIYNRPLIYLDSAASSQKPLQVLEKEIELHKSFYGNIHRAAHFMADKATLEFEVVRTRVQQFINAKSRNEIIFTKGTTDSINLVAHSFGERYLNENDEIIVSEMEHHSNLVPWQLIAARKNAKIIKLPFNETGEIEVDVFQKLLSPKTKLLALAHVSNVLGTINPIEEIIRIAHTHNVPVFIDGAQAIQHIPVDVQKLDVDFYAFSAHKMYGPNGTGVLYGKEKWLDEMPPYQGGGEMISEVTFEHTTFNNLPYKFEAGTPNITGVISFGAALNIIEEIGLDKIAAWEQQLMYHTTTKLKAIPLLRIYGEAPDKSGVISFNIDDIHPYDIGTLLDKTGIAVRTGTHCASPVMQYFNIHGTVRVSFGMYTSMEDIDSFIEALIKVISILKT